MIIDVEKGRLNKLIVNTLKSESMLCPNQIKITEMFGKIEVVITTDFILNLHTEGYFINAMGAGAVILNKLFDYQIYILPRQNTIKAGFPSITLDNILKTLTHFGIGYCFSKKGNTTKSLATKEYKFSVPILNAEPAKIDEIDYFDEITYLLNDVEIHKFRIKPTQYTITPTGYGTSSSPTGENKVPIPAEDGYINDNCELAKQSYKKKIGDKIIIKTNDKTYKYEIIGLVKYSLLNKRLPLE